MLIRFELENFRSVRSEAALTLTAINYYKEHEDQLINDTLPGLAGMKFLRVAALFGPNASGKSTIFQALAVMRSMVTRSASVSIDKTLPYNPYLLDEKSKHLPTRFFVAFTCENVRFEYTFSFTKHAITEEKLSSFPKGREQVWFTRKTKLADSKDSQTIIKDSSFLRIPAALNPLVNDNMLLLSLLANYPKYEAAVKIRPVIDWFSNELTILKRGPKSVVDYPFSGEIVDGAAGTDFQRLFIQEIMKKADIGINETKVKKIPFPELVKAIGKEDEAELLEFLGEHDEQSEYKTVVFDHMGENGKVEFNLESESDGTFQLFSLSGHIAQALDNGSTLFVDEIDASLHPILVREVVRCFLDPTSNPKNAQLVFTAHNPCLLEEDLLRRDEIWLTEKLDGATELYPLSEFSPRKDESLVNGYLLGRYSATPVVPTCFGRCRTYADGDSHDN